MANLNDIFRVEVFPTSLLGGDVLGIECPIALRLLVFKRHEAETFTIISYI